MDTLWNDLRYTGRTLLRTPGFTLVVLLTLALGIGATTAIFSVVDAVLFRSLPYPDSGRLVMLWKDYRERGGGAEELFNLPDYYQLRAESRTIAEMAALSDWTPVLSGIEVPERLEAAWVSHNYFDLFGARPVLGRSFLPEEETPERARLVVLSHALWQNRFGGDPGIVGGTITLDHEPYTVVGVASAGFRPPLLDAALWAPLPDDPTGATRMFNILQVFGRLAPRVTPLEASRELNALAAGIAAEHPDTEAGVGVHLASLKDHIVGPVQPGLFAMLGAVGLMLLLACVNVANLLLARAVTRRREISIRCALGASRIRLARQLLTEGLFLTLLGGALGVLFAFWGVAILVGILPADTPRLDEVAIDARVLGFAVTLAVLTGLAFGLVPAWRASSPNLRGTLGLGSGGMRTTAGRSWARSALVVAELSIALMLLIGAGLLMRSFLALQAVHPGFSVANLLTVEVELPRTQYSERDQVVAFYAELLRRIESLPGVVSAGEVSRLPLSGQTHEAYFALHGGPDPQPAELIQAGYRSASPGYFRTMQIPLLQGRTFEERDGHLDAPTVAVVNQSMARRLWPGGDPLDKQIHPQWAPEAPLTVIGVVGDVRHGGLERAPRPELFLPAARPRQGFTTVVVRTASDPLALAPLVRQELRSLDPALPASNISTMQQRIAASLALPRLYHLLFGAFAAIALLLAAVGIYGVTAYSVSQRTREIGIRSALGAQRRDVLLLILRQMLLVLGIGLGLGLGAAIAFSRVLGSLLYGLSPTDPITYAGVVLLLTGIALLAVYLPARRAVRVDPMIALRTD